MSAEKKQKQAIVKLITIIPLIICLIVIIFLIITVFSKGKATQPEIESADEKNKEVNPIEANPAQNNTAQKTDLENKTVAESQIDIEKIKMEIITGKREDVPSEIDEPKYIIIGEYLSGCDAIIEINERITCYELYYLNKNVSLKQQKMNCEKLSGNEQAGCLDELYYTLANTQDSNFCAAITDNALSEKCLAIG